MLLDKQISLLYSMNNELNNDTIIDIANRIRTHLKKFKTYTFRPVRIDGIYCYVVIHRKSKIINFEAIHVSCLLKIGNERKMQKYSLLYKKYKTLENAVEYIRKVVSTYKLYNGDLVNPSDFELLKLEEQILPFEESQKCSVCLENTQETTVCNHYICFRCREKCIYSNNTDCPICRNSDVMKFFNIDNRLINNAEYGILRNAIDYEYNSGDSSYEPDDDSPDTSDTAESSDTEEESTDSNNFDIHANLLPIFFTPNIFASASSEFLNEIAVPRLTDLHDTD